MKRLFWLVVLGLFVYAAWKRLAGTRDERHALVSFADGSSVVLDVGSPDLERLADLARPALRQ